MHHLTRKRTALALLCICFFLSSSPFVEASHSTRNDPLEDYNGWLRGQSSTFKRNVKKLDDDVEKEFAIPILFGVTLTDVTPNFGFPRDGGKRTHEGLDIMGLEGTPVVTPTEAVVMKTGTGKTAGKYVYTRNPGGETFAYMHLDSIANIKAGQILKEGDFIGTVGDTGNAKGTPPHLHFEVRKKKALDPHPRIAEAFSFEEKIEYLNRALSASKQKSKLAETLVKLYAGQLQKAQTEGLALDKALLSALKKQRDTLTLTKVPTGLALGKESAHVATLQTALILEATGPFAESLGAIGATGYFGPLTESALREYQKARNIPTTGIFDTTTRSAFKKTL